MTITYISIPIAIILTIVIISTLIYIYNKLYYLPSDEELLSIPIQKGLDYLMNMGSGIGYDRISGHIERVTIPSTSIHSATGLPGIRDKYDEIWKTFDQSKHCKLIKDFKEKINNIYNTYKPGIMNSIKRTFNNIYYPKDAYQKIAYYLYTNNLLNEFNNHHNEYLSYNRCD